METPLCSAIEHVEQYLLQTLTNCNKEETFGLCPKDHCRSRGCIVAMFMAVFAPPTIYNYSASRYAFTIAIVRYGYLSFFFTHSKQSLCNNVKYTVVPSNLSKNVAVKLMVHQHRLTAYQDVHFPHQLRFGQEFLHC